MLFTACKAAPYVIIKFHKDTNLKAIIIDASTKAVSKMYGGNHGFPGLSIKRIRDASRRIICQATNFLTKHNQPKQSRGFEEAFPYI